MLLHFTIGLAQRNQSASFPCAPTATPINIGCLGCTIVAKLNNGKHYWITPYTVKDMAYILGTCPPSHAELMYRAVKAKKEHTTLAEEDLATLKTLESSSMVKKLLNLPY